MKELLIKTTLNKCGIETLVEIFVQNERATVFHNGIETKSFSCSGSNERLAIFALLESRGECDIAEELRYTIIDFETFFEGVQE